MASILQYEEDIKKYNNLKKNINFIIEKLRLSIDNMDSLNRQIVSKYNINDNGTPIINNIKKLKNDTEKTYNYLRKNIIPAIDLEISSFKKLKNEFIEEN